MEGRGGGPKDSFSSFSTLGVCGCCGCNAPCDVVFGHQGHGRLLRRSTERPNSLPAAQDRRLVHAARC